MTGRHQLLVLLQAHPPFNAHEANMRGRLIEFVLAHGDCFHRTLLIGHVTASAWVIDRERTHALMTHHAKLDKWLQMGGHCDGDPDVLGVAFREVEEESGLVDVIPLLDGAIFDLDAHDIPARGAEPQHVHYDVRFLFEADRAAPLRLSGESHELRWVPLDEIASLNTDESVLRMVAKTPPLGR